jgi:hypothetical protein
MPVACEHNSPPPCVRPYPPIPPFGILTGLSYPDKGSWARAYLPYLFLLFFGLALCAGCAACVPAVASRRAAHARSPDPAAAVTAADRSPVPASPVTATAAAAADSDAAGTTAATSHAAPADACGPSPVCEPHQEALGERRNSGPGKRRNFDPEAKGEDRTGGAVGTREKESEQQ